MNIALAWERTLFYAHNAPPKWRPVRGSLFSPTPGAVAQIYNGY